MSQATELSPLIQTKLNRSRVASDLIERPRLLAYLAERSDRPFTLVSVPAGYGKTTLLAQWLEQAPYRVAWLSLDENDNNLLVFSATLWLPSRPFSPRVARSRGVC